MSALTDAQLVELGLSFSADEVASAQGMLDIQPDQSPYWDTGAGQDDLEIIQALGLQPAHSNAVRLAMHSEAMRAAREQMEWL